MRILVTGAAGFIGFHLCRQLVKANNNVLGIDNLNSYYETKLKHDIPNKSKHGKLRRKHDQKSARMFRCVFEFNKNAFVYLYLYICL